MATDLSIIINDKSDAFYVSGRWLASRLPTAYLDTTWTASGQGSFDFSFQGTSAAFTGIFPDSGEMTVQIDKGTPFSTNDTVKGTYKQWFQTPKLFDGSHTIAVVCPEGTQIDFAIVNVTAGGNQTSLAGRDIIVDNDSPSISYSGDWNRSASRFNSVYYSNLGYPYGNSTHRSSTPGDTFRYRFTGTSVSVYGIFSWSNLGTLAATYTIDGTTVPQTYNVTSLTWETSGGDVANYLYYSKDNLSAGDHTLIVNVTVANNLTFVLDYITHKLSSELPSSSPTITSLSSTSSPSPSEAQMSGTPQPAAIVGGVIGVLALGVIAATLGRWLFLQWRRAKQLEGIFIYNDTNSNWRQHYMSQLRPQGYPSRQPVKQGRLDPAGQATGSDSNIPLPDPPNIDDPAAEVAAEPPPYDDLFCARLEVTQP